MKKSFFHESRDARSRIGAQLGRIVRPARELRSLEGAARHLAGRVVVLAIRAHLLDGKVVADGGELPAEGDRERQADVTEAHHADAGNYGWMTHAPARQPAALALCVDSVADRARAPTDRPRLAFVASSPRS